VCPIRNWYFLRNSFQSIKLPLSMKSLVVKDNSMYSSYQWVFGILFQQMLRYHLLLTCLWTSLSFHSIFRKLIRKAIQSSKALIPNKK